MGFSARRLPYRFLYLVAVLIFAQASGQQTRIGKLLQFKIEGASSTSSEDLIRMSSDLREGMDVMPEDVQKAVKNLWELGLYSDVQLILSEQTPEGIVLSIRAQEYPRMEKMEISGNKKLKKEDIEKDIGFFRAQVISPGQLAKAKRKLLKSYAEKGFTLAEIDYETEPSTQAGRVILKIKIDEGEKVQIKRIQFFGNNAFKDGELRKKMKDTKEDRWWRGADFKKDKYEEDQENILTFYRNHGYRDAEILRDSIYYDATKKDMFIDIWVREGRPYYLGNVTWEGNKLFSEEFLTSLLELKPGDALSEEKYQKSVREKIGGAYYDLGYIYAQVNPVETLRGRDTLDVKFLIREMNPVKIRRILISGNTRTKDRVIRREIRIRPGDVFSKELLMRSHRDLMMLNYFATVEPDVVTVQNEAMDQIDLSFKVEEKSTDTANLSAGYSELDKFIGSVGLGMNNLFGNGQQLSLDWNFGRWYRAMNLGFTEPWFLNTPKLVGASIYDIKRDAYYIGYSQRSRGLSLRFGRRFRWPDNYFRGDWIYRFDHRVLGDFSSSILSYNPNNIVNEEYPQITSGITQIISRNSLDQPEFPTRGSQVSLTTEIAATQLGGNIGYHKHIFSAEFFFPTVLSKLVLFTRAQAGFMEGLVKGKNPPYLEHFFMGGSGLSQSTPLRGYDDPLAGYSYYYEGGKTMLKTTVELRFPIIPNPTMYGLLFAEAGNTWAKLSETDPFDLRRSAGIGARIYMPMIGMIGFDYAYGYDHYDSTGRRYGQWKPHFVFGRSF